MATITAAPSFRGTFIQGTNNSLLLKVTTINGVPTDPELITYTIDDPSGTEVVATTAPEKVTLGLFVADWQLDADQTIGEYLITWDYDVDGVNYQELQSIVIVEDATDTVLYSGRTLLIRQSLELMIACAQSIPIYFQQAQVSRDRQTFKWTRPLWNQTIGTKIYRNKSVVNSGYEINYFQGTVTFDNPLTEFDIVNADYNFRWFSDEKLDLFISNALNRYNSYPPHTAETVNFLNDRFLPAILYVAAADALRNLMLCLNFEEPAQFFGGNEEASKRFGQIDTLKKNYEGDADKILENKKFGPYIGLTRSVVVPEFTLPGGRSRWFRYLFSGGGASS